MPVSSPRLLSFGLACLLGSASFAVTESAAPESPQSDIENAKYQFEGILIRPEFVRASPGENFYPTIKLDKDAHIVVVGAKGSWLKVVPPEGSFSYVQKAFVKRFGDGKKGQVSAPQLIVRAGSSLQPVMWVVQTKLQPKDLVEIIGEEDQYFKIRPPEGAYLYIAKDAVKPMQPVEVAGAPVPPTPVPAKPTPSDPPVRPEPPVPGATPATQPAIPGPGTILPTLPLLPFTQPATPPGLASDPTPPAATGGPDVVLTPNKPQSVAEAVQQLQALETQFAEASQKPLVDQPLPELTAGYEQVAATQGLTPITQRIAEVRLETLKFRAEARVQLLATQEARKVGGDKLMVQQTERKELEQAMKKVEVHLFAAVGTLRTSSLQVARTTLYRLTDPQNGRTIAYIWGTDPKVAGLVDQFVGVKGQIQTDQRFNFKVINPSGIETLDPAKLHTAYSADISPASMLPRAASTGTPE